MVVKHTIQEWLDIKQVTGVHISQPMKNHKRKWSFYLSKGNKMSFMPNDYHIIHDSKIPETWVSEALKEIGEMNGTIYDSQILSRQD